ncbi:MAG: hypothetical protein EXS11_06465 [Gemmataceae bacterium]|nr:hypothetical protein [Gemmataceae bacterium]
MQPERPTAEVVQRFLIEWEAMDNFAFKERSLALLFQNFCPNNSVLEHVLLKVSALNDFYSTNNFNTYAVARHIVSLDINPLLAKSDMALVNALAQVSMGKNSINFYSFATKYCNHHRSSDYPIYDQYVEKMLVNFGKLDRFTEFTKPELKRYARFVEIILAFRDHYHLSSFPLRQIDIYLWLGGKKAFSRQYKVA